MNNSKKQDRILKNGLILLIVAILTFIAMTFTFAKYVSTGSFNDDARVAKWGLNIPGNETSMGLFDSSYKDPYDSSVTVHGLGPDGKTDEKVVAPGTEKSGTFIIAEQTGHAPETMYNWDVDFKATGDTDMLEELDKLDQFSWYYIDPATGLPHSQLKYYDHDGIAGLESSINALTRKNVAPNKLPDSISKNGQAATEDFKQFPLTIGWVWIYDIGKEAADIADTRLGDMVARGELGGIQLNLKINAYQIVEPTPVDTVIVDGHLSQESGGFGSEVEISLNSTTSNYSQYLRKHIDDDYQFINVPVNSSYVLRVESLDGKKLCDDVLFDVGTEPVTQNVELKDADLKEKVTFDANGGDWDGSATLDVENIFNQKYVFPAAEPTRATTETTRYTFAGYYTEPTGGDPLDENSVVQAAQDHTIYTHWDETHVNTAKFDTTGHGSINPYQPIVSFDDIYWRVDDASKLIVNDTIIDASAEEHFDFDGWYLDDEKLEPDASGVISGGETAEFIAKFVAQPGLTVSVSGEITEAGEEGWDASVNVTLTSDKGNYYHETVETYVGGMYKFEKVPANDNYTLTVTSLDGRELCDPVGIEVKSDPVEKDAEIKPQDLHVNVTFDGNGGKWGQDASLTIDNIFNDTYKLPANDPVRQDSATEKYEFEGYFTEPTGGDKVTTDTVIERGQNHTLYAHWKVTKLNIASFDASGSGVIEPDDDIASYQEIPWYFNNDKKLCVNGTVIDASANEGNYFDAWYLDNEKLGPDASGTIKDGQTAKFIANFVEIPRVEISGTVTQEDCGRDTYDTTVVVRLMSADGKSTFNKTVNIGENYSFSNILGKSKYTMRVYSTDAMFLTSAIIIDVDTSSVTQNIQLQNSFLTMPVTFDANGGNWDGSSTVSVKNIFNTDYQVPWNDPVRQPTTKIKYEFAGYWTEKTGGQQITDEDVVERAQDHTLYAHWDEIPVNTATFDAIGHGKVVPSSDITSFDDIIWSVDDASVLTVEGMQITATPDAGYVFEGWSLNDQKLAPDASGKISGGSTAKFVASFDNPADVTVSGHLSQQGEDWANTEVNVLLESAEANYSKTKAVKIGSDYLFDEVPAYSDYMLKVTSKDGKDLCSPVAITVEKTAVTLDVELQNFDLKLDVTYDGNGGYWLDDQSKPLTKMVKSNVFNTHYNLPEVQPKKDDAATTYFTFAGYWTEKTGGVQITEDNIVELAKGHTVYTHWDEAPISFATAKFVAGEHGSVSPSADITSKEHVYWRMLPYGLNVNTYDISAIPEDNYDLDGWYVNGKKLKTFDEGFIEPGETVVFEARFEELHNVNVNGSVIQDSADASNTQINLTLASGDTTVYKTINANVGQKFSFTDVPPKKLYTIVAKSLDGRLLYSDSDSFYVGKQDETHDVHFKDAALKETITFDGNGGKWGEDDQVSVENTFNTHYRLPGSAPSKEGTSLFQYVFEGYFTEQTGGVEVTEDTIVEHGQNHTLYAHWKAYKLNTLNFASTTGGTIEPTPWPITSFDEINWSVSNTNQLTVDGSSFTTKPSAGYIFDSWTLDDVAVKPGDSGKVSDGAEKKFTANFVQAPNVKVSGTLTQEASENNTEVDIDIQSVSTNHSQKQTVAIGSGFSFANVPGNSSYNLTVTSKDGKVLYGPTAVAVGTTDVVKDVELTTLSLTETVTFNGNGGAWDASTSIGVDNVFNKNYTLPEKAPTHANVGSTMYIFDGYWTDAEGGDEVTTGVVVEKARNHTVYAHWRIELAYPEFKAPLPYSGKDQSADDPALWNNWDSEHLEFVYDKGTLNAKEVNTYAAYMRPINGAVWIEKQTDEPMPSAWSIGKADTTGYIPPVAMPDASYVPWDQSLVVDGSCMGDTETMYYCAKVNDTTKPDPDDPSWSEVAPTACEPGTYSIWYKIDGGAHYKGIEATGPITMKITKLNGFITEAPTPLSNQFKVDEEGQIVEHTLAWEGKVYGGEMLYGVSTVKGKEPTEWTANPPVSGQLGTYYIWYKAEPYEEHYRFDNPGPFELEEPAVISQGFRDRTFNVPRMFMSFAYQGKADQSVLGDVTIDYDKYTGGNDTVKFEFVGDPDPIVSVEKFSDDHWLLTPKTGGNAGYDLKIKATIIDNNGNFKPVEVTKDVIVDDFEYRNYREWEEQDGDATIKKASATMIKYHPYKDTGEVLNIPDSFEKEQGRSVSITIGDGTNTILPDWLSPKLATVNVKDTQHLWASLSINNNAFVGANNLTASNINFETDSIDRIYPSAFDTSIMHPAGNTIVYDKTGRALLGKSKDYVAPEVMVLPGNLRVVADEAFNYSQDTEDASMQNYTTRKVIVDVAPDGWTKASFGTRSFTWFSNLETFVVKASGVRDQTQFASGWNNMAGHKGDAGIVLAGGYNIHNRFGNDGYMYTEVGGQLHDTIKLEDHGTNYYDHTYLYLTDDLVADASLKDETNKAMIEIASDRHVIDLNGHTLDRGRHGGDSQIDGCTAIVMDDAPSGKTAPVLRIDNTHNINTTADPDQPGKITGGYCSAGKPSTGGVFVGHGATCTLVNGAIMDCKGVEGGAVATAGNAGSIAVFKMYGGVIANNTVVPNSAYCGGGAVDVKTCGQFIMQGGLITSNHSIGTNGRCGGVYIITNSTRDVKFEISGGELSGNDCVVQQGGCDVHSQGLSHSPAFNITGGHVGYLGHQGTYTGPTESDFVDEITAL